MTDIAAFIAQRLDEDEAAAKAAVSASGGDWGRSWHHDGDDDDPASWKLWGEDGATAEVPREVAAHASRHDPARVLREIEAKRLTLGYADWARRIFEEDELRESAGEVVHNAGYRMGQWHGYKAVLSALASAWSDHPDFDPGWSAVGSEGGKA